MDVLIEEFFITETWKGISVKKSLGQSRVYVKNSDGKFVEYGLLGHSSMCLSGLCGVPAELGEAIAEACSKQLKKKVTFTGAPIKEPDQLDSEQEESDDE